MDQLIDIKCIPIKLEFETQPIRVESEKVSDVSLDIEVQKGGLDIKNNIPKVDTIEISDKPHVTPIRTAQRGMIGDVAKTLSKKHEYFPTVKLDSAHGGHANKVNSSKNNDFGVNYKSDEVKVSAKNEVKKKVIPSDIEYNVTQYPDVVIDFIGDMIYVPPSSNPNYEEK